MNCFVDWSCGILPLMRGCIETPEEGAQAISLLHTRLGFNRFLATPTYDSQREPVSHFLLRRDRAAEDLCALIPKQCKLALGAGVVLNPSLHKVDGLEKLLVGRGRLPIVLPLTEYDDWIDLELNRLLYRRKYKLLFLSMERSIALYPADCIEKLLRIEYAIFQFNFRALTDPACCRVIQTLLQRNRTVLLGTGIDSIDTCYAYDGACYLEKSDLHPADLQVLLRSSNTAWQRLGL